jgi:hypothetical protein
VGDKPTREIEEKGLKAYEQARAYERLRTWRLPVSYAIPPLGLAATGVAAWVTHRPWLCGVSLSLALLVAVRLWLEWRRWRLRYAENVALLAKLKADYGDALPWIQVENHFAALEALKRELAQEREGADP